MGFDFTIVKGYGYVIPKKDLTDDELGELVDLIDQDIYIEISCQGCYGEIADGEPSQVFICLDAELLAEYASSPSNLFFNCRDFACVAYGCDLYNEEALLHHEISLSSSLERKKLDKLLKKHVPNIYKKIKENHNNRYENWIFGYSS